MSYTRGRGKKNELDRSKGKERWSHGGEGQEGRKG
jgi:hypothetical protein